MLPLNSGKTEYSIMTILTSGICMRLKTSSPIGMAKAWK